MDRNKQSARQHHDTTSVGQNPTYQTTSTMDTSKQSVRRHCDMTSVGQSPTYQTTSTMGRNKQSVRRHCNTKPVDKIPLTKQPVQWIEINSLSTLWHDVCRQNPTYQTTSTMDRSKQSARWRCETMSVGPTKSHSVLGNIWIATKKKWISVKP
jgi:cell wall assembly regulator SMI1